MSTARARRVFLSLGLSVGAILTAFVGCSSDSLPPGAGDAPASTYVAADGSVSADTGATRVDGGSSGSSTDAATDDDTGTSSVDAGSDAAVFVCLDSTATTIDGGAGPTSCAQPSCAAHCSNILQNYKLGIAQYAIACIQKLAACDENDLSPVNVCVDQATGRSCADSTTAAYCVPMIQNCDPNLSQPGAPIDVPGCESFSSALSTTGRATFAACLQAGTDAGDCTDAIAPCSYQIRQ